MKLKLNNFRCWRDKTFTFPDKGLILLSGDSGAGKSTIFLAIKFALFGNVRRPFTYNTKTCRVELEIPTLQLKIMRQKGPNKLVVNEIYEEDEAQGVIEEKLGINRYEFDASAYIPQKGVSSILSMSPSEQLVFLEKISFNQGEVEDARKKIFQMVKNRNETVIQTNAELDFSKKEYKGVDVKKTLDKPVKNIKKWKKRRLAISKKIDELKEEKARLAEDQANLKLYISAHTRYNEEQKINAAIQQEIQDEIDDLGEPFPEEDKEEAENKLRNYKKWLEYSSKKDGYDEERKRYESMVEEEMDEKRQELSELEKEMWLEDDPLTAQQKKKKLSEMILSLHNRQRIQEDLNILLEDLSSIEPLSHLKEEKKISSLKTEMSTVLKAEKKELENIKERYENEKERLTKAELEGEKRECPNCHTFLRLEDDHLVCVGNEEEEEEVDISQLKTELRSLKKQVSSKEGECRKIDTYLDRIGRIESALSSSEIDGIDNDLIITEDLIRGYEKEQKDLKTYISENETLAIRASRLKEHISKKKVSSSLQSIKKRLLDTKKKICQLREEVNEPDVPVTTAEITKLEDYINTNTLLYTKVSELQDRLNSENRSLLKAKENLEKVKKEIGYKTGEKIKSKKEIVKQLREVEEDLIKLGKAKEDDQELEVKIQAYEEESRKLKEKKKWRQKIRQLEAKELLANNNLSYGMKLKERSQHAEALTLEHTISSINEHAKVHLEDMFPDQPISVSLETYKQTKVKKLVKPKINVLVNYKGNESDLYDLSGGEQDRCHLAFILSMNEMFSSSLLMLDECISSLESERSSDILNSLQVLGSNKLILVVAHQVTTGLFDHVLEI